MFKFIYVFPLSIYLFTSANIINIDNKTNAYRKELRFGLNKNKAYKRYETEPFTQFKIRTITYSKKELWSNLGLMVYISNVPRSKYKFKISTYDSSGNYLENSNYMTHGEKSYYDFEFKFGDKTKIASGLVTYVFEISDVYNTYVVGKFELLSSTAILDYEHPSFAARTQITCEPNLGYSEAYGDYIEIVNFKEIYEIPTFLRFTLNDLKIKLRYELAKETGHWGQTFILFPVPSGFYEMSEEIQSLYNVINEEIKKGIYWKDNNGETFTFYNDNDFYVQYGTNHHSLKYQEGYEPTNDFCIPREFYSELKECYFGIKLVDFGWSGLNAKINFKVRFTEYVSNPMYDVVGEIGEGEIDDDIEDDELEIIEL